MTDRSGRTVRLGVVSAGSWATLAHIPAILRNPDAVLVGVSDPDSDRLASTADHYGIEGRFGDHRALIAEGLDALVVASPHATHYEIARDALDAGLHVLVEKPLTVRAEHARDLQARAEAGRRHLVVGYNANFGPGAIAARSTVRSGELGEITLVTGLFASAMEDYLRGAPGDQEPYVLGGPSRDTYADPTLSGGGQAQSQATHGLEMLLWVTGLAAWRVSALMAARGAPVDLVDGLLFECHSGTIGTFASVGTLRPGQAAQQELRYYGTRGVLLQDLLSGAVVLHPAQGPMRQLAAASTDETVAPFSAPVDCLIDVILGRAENRAPAAPAVATVALLDAAYRSAALGGVPQETGCRTA